ncbi:MAG: glycoside hydrolase family 15 protein [Candidatus Asgardarchaeia archaeon]
MIGKLLQPLNSLQLPSNLFIASDNPITEYDRIWIRDNLYSALAYEATGQQKIVEKIYHALLDLFLKFEWKIDEVIREKPTEDYKFLHPMYTKDLEEITAGWGWKQNDTIGGFLYHIGKLWDKKYNVIRNGIDLKIINKLARYLESIQYWEDEDNGMWEENKEIHASSVGACVAGLKSVSNLIHIPHEVIANGEKTLTQLLPRESQEKPVDLSLLSLICPYQITTLKQTYQILQNIETYLIRKKGSIRYIGDKYYMENDIEASWTMGLPWLAICYYLLKDFDKYNHYIAMSIECLNRRMEMPELYKEDKIPNENTPLGWPQSLLIVALSL